MRTRTTGAILGLLLVAAAAPALAQDQNQWGYDKGFFFRTSNFELKISTRTQFRYTYTMTDENSLTDDNGAFNLPRTRLRLDGFAFYPWLKYKVQYDFTGQTYTTATSVAVPAGPATVSLSNKRGPDLRDLYFDLTRHPWASVRLGQFKAPLGMQEMTSSGDQEFVDRSIASEAFAPSRQQGAMLWGTSYAKKFGYEAGVFNGNARNVTANDNTGYMYVGRVHWDPLGEYKLSESAVDHPEKPLWTIGASYMLNTTEASLLKTAEELSQDTLEGFFGFKYKRLFVLADYYARTQEQAASAPDVDSSGAIAQVGVFLVPRKLELAARWSELDPDTDVDNNIQTESRIGFGYYFSKHELKFQADYGQIKNEASATDEKTNQFRAQLQVVF
jgi:phosphate-selective porin OprO/OprP